VAATSLAWWVDRGSGRRAP